MTPNDSGLRFKTLRHLRLLASERLQMEYQTSMPLAQVPAELFSIWFIDLAHSDTAISTYSGAFDVHEMKQLEKFHKAFKRAAAVIDPLPFTVAQLQALPAWKRVVKAAGNCLAHIEKGGGDSGADAGD